MLALKQVSKWAANAHSSDYPDYSGFATTTTANHYHHDRNRQIKALEIVRQSAPMSAKQISAPQIVVTQTAAPRKLNSTNFRHGMWSAPASSEASTRMPKRNRARKTVAAPYARKAAPLAPHVSARIEKTSPVAFDQRTPPVSPQRKTQLSPQSRGHGPDHNDPGKLAIHVRNRPESWPAAESFPRQGQAGILQQQQRRHGPISVVHTAPRSRSRMWWVMICCEQSRRRFRLRNLLTLVRNSINARLNSSGHSS